MDNYNKPLKHKPNCDGFGDACDGSYRPSQGAGAPYLTITNKSTSTSVDFDQVFEKIESDLTHFCRFSKSVRLWIEKSRLEFQ